MIVGNGMIAKAFEEYRDCNNVLIFASGVSDSSETDPIVFKREMVLLLKSISDNPDKVLVYFSSIDLNSQIKKPYMEHKRCMESIIKLMADKHIILRLNNVIGAGGNKNTLVNYIRDRIRNKEDLTIILGATRSIVDVDDVKTVVSHLLSQGAYGPHTFGGVEVVPVLRIAGFFNPGYDRIKIVDGEDVCNSGNSMYVHGAINKMNIADGYTERIIKKYYPTRHGGVD